MSRYYYEKDNKGRWVKKDLDKFRETKPDKSRISSAIARAKERIEAEKKRQAKVYEARQAFYRKQKMAQFKAEQKASAREQRRYERTRRSNVQSYPAMSLGQMPSMSGLGFNNERKKKRGALEL